MTIFLIFLIFIENINAWKLFIDNTFAGTTKDGSYELPFLSIESALDNSNYSLEETELNLILLSNADNYSIKSTIFLKFSVKIIFDSNNGEKAGLVFNESRIELKEKSKIFFFSETYFFKILKIVSFSIENLLVYYMNDNGTSYKNLLFLFIGRFSNLTLNVW